MSTAVQEKPKPVLATPKRLPWIGETVWYWRYSAGTDPVRPLPAIVQSFAPNGNLNLVLIGEGYMTWQGNTSYTESKQMGYWSFPDKDTSRPNRI